MMIRRAFLLPILIRLLLTRYNEFHLYSHIFKFILIKKTKKNTLIYAPIKDLLLEEIGYIIEAIQSPRGTDNCFD